MPHSKQPTPRTTVFKGIIIPCDVPHSLPDSAVIYLSWIAYPNPEEHERRNRFMLAALSHIHKTTVLRKHAPEIIRNIKKHNAVNTINRAFNRINYRRVPAALTAVARWEGQSLNKSARLWANTLFLTYPNTQEPASPYAVNNVKKRIWSESLPMLPMTLALPLNLAGKPEEVTTIYKLLLNADWVPEAVDIARRLAPIVAKSFTPSTLFIPELKTTQILNPPQNL